MLKYCIGHRIKKLGNRDIELVSREARQTCREVGGVKH